MVDEQIVRILGAQKMTLSREDCTAILSAANNTHLNQEIAMGGDGEEFEEILSGGGEVNNYEFFRWQFVEGQGRNALEHLKNNYDFNSFETLEHYGNTWKLRVSRDSQKGVNYSIGYLFGVMEDMQHQFDISEYSVAQTTLEQIFNNFAKEDYGKRNNNRRKSSVVKK